MKKVFSTSSEVAHIWAQQTQDEGRCSNMFFEGKSIFSYGRHFEIARFITPEIVFLTTREYSPTTSRHIVDVRNAVSHKTVFRVPSFENHHENVEYFLSEMERIAGDIARSRKHGEFHTGELISLIKSAENYLTVFKKELPAKLIKNSLFIMAKYDKPDYYKAIADKQAVLRKAENAKKKALRLEVERKNAEALEAWKRGTEGVYISRAYSLPIALRVKEGVVETSHGARVPLKLALGLFKAIKKGKPVHGLKLKDYTVTSFDGSILTVGCHKIPMAEMERLYASLAVPA